MMPVTCHPLCADEVNPLGYTLGSSVSLRAHCCPPRDCVPGSVLAQSRGRGGCSSPALVSLWLLGVPREACTRCWYHSSFSRPVRPNRYRHLSLQSPRMSCPDTGTFLVPSSPCSSVSCSSLLLPSPSAGSGRSTQMGYFLFHVRFRARLGGHRKTCSTESGVRPGQAWEVPVGGSWGPPGPPWRRSGRSSGG